MNQLENKLSSREVCEMIEMEHSKLLRKIDGINQDFNQAKIGFVKYWTEGTYRDSKGEERREFQITKKGCEFLAHKTTGTKGNLFTDRYMDKFAAMEQVIETGSYNSKGITKDDVFDLIKSLPEDGLKNEVSRMILERFLPIEKKQVISTELNLKVLLNEFLQDETVILRQTEYGLAVDKQKLYNFFGNHGLRRYETLKELDKANLIFHRDDCRTIQVRHEGYPVRVVIVKG